MSHLVLTAGMLISAALAGFAIGVLMFMSSDNKTRSPGLIAGVLFLASLLAFSLVGTVRPGEHGGWYSGIGWHLLIAVVAGFVIGLLVAELTPLSRNDQTRTP